MRVLKKIIIFILVLAILAAGGFFGYRYYMQWKAAQQPVGEITAVYADGILTIEGTGQMPNYSSNEENREWDPYKDEITKVVVGEGVTSIGKNAFMNYQKLTEVDLGSAVELIDMNAFNGCENLTTINIPVSVTKIGESAFWDTENLKNISYEGTREDWEKIEIGDNNLVLESNSVSCAGDEVVEDTSAVSSTDVPQTPEVAKVSMYRLTDPSTDESYYTTLDAERDDRVANGWTYDGIMWKEPETSNTPIYRLTNPNTGSHFYVIDGAAMQDHLAAGWTVDAIIGYSDDSMSVPVYSVRNPNAVIATHCYTINTEEVAYLEAAGWINEGIAWYACS